MVLTFTKVRLVQYGMTMQLVSNIQYGFGLASIYQQHTIFCMLLHPIYIHSINYGLLIDFGSWEINYLRKLDVFIFVEYV